MGAPNTASSSAPPRPDVHKTALNNNDLSHYLSLIQQYLNVFRLDNAIFLAERCVAEFPSDSSAVYWLAVAYYRSGQVPRARHLLTGHSLPNMLYLSAQCSYELNEYTKAEDALLKDCRFQFRQQQQTGTLEEWILQTTVSAFLFLAGKSVNCVEIVFLISCHFVAMPHSQWRCRSRITR